MRVKSGVKLDGLSWPLWYAAAVVDYAHQAQGWGEATITSALDAGDAFGPPRAARSAHPHGGAIDIRLHNVPQDQRQAFGAYLAGQLAPHFRVLLEVDHYHIEYGTPDYV